MQPQTNNPFPVTDTPDTESASATTNQAVQTPQPAPPSVASTTPVTPGSDSIFVLPSQGSAQSITPKGPLGGIERLLIGVFSHPVMQLPEFIKDMFARYLPWMTLMSVFILAPILFIGVAMGGFLGILTSFYSLNTNLFYWLTLILLSAHIGLLIASIRPLLSERRLGWSILFISVFISIGFTLTNIFAQFINPFIVIAATLLLGSGTLFVLFQTRGYYTK